MPEDIKGQKIRAENLREQIEKLKSGKEQTPQDDDVNRKPGESPKEYMERRERALSEKKDKK